MNEILMSVYGAVLPAAPYVIAAYVLVWLAIFVYVLIVVRGLKKNESDIVALEKAMARKSGDGNE